MRQADFVSRLGIRLAMLNVVLLIPGFVALLGGTRLPVDHFIWRHFDVGSETNLFAWYSSFLLASGGGAALVNFWLDGVRVPVSHWRFAWLGVFVVMIGLSLEEVAQVHEAVQGRVILWARGDSGSWTWLRQSGAAWIVPYSPAIAAVIVFFFVTFFKMFRGAVGPRSLALGGLCLWIGAIALELFYVDVLRRWGGWYLGIESLFEEGAEIFGSTAMLLSFIWYGREGLKQILPIETVEASPRSRVAHRARRSAV